MKKLVLIFSMLILPLASQAQEAIYLSGLLGMTQVDANYDDGTKDSLDAELSYGLRGGVLFNDHFAVGLFLHQYKTDEISQPANIGIDYTFNNIMGEFTYFFTEADENSFWVSGLLGITQSEVSSSLNTQDESDTSYGASVGYNVMLAPNFSISPQFTYIYTDSNLVNFHQISGLINLTFWL